MERVAAPKQPRRVAPCMSARQGARRERSARAGDGLVCRSHVRAGSRRGREELELYKPRLAQLNEEREQWSKEDTQTHYMLSTQAASTIDMMKDVADVTAAAREPTRRPRNGPS